MAAASDPEDLKEIRRARADVVLGDDWVAPDTTDADLRARREKRRLFSINRSPLAQKIVTFNLVAVTLMVAGILYLNPFRDSLVFQRETAIVSQAMLVADMVGAYAEQEAELAAARAEIDPLAESDDVAPTIGESSVAALSRATIRDPVYLYDATGTLVGEVEARNLSQQIRTAEQRAGPSSTAISDFLTRIWSFFSFKSTEDLAGSEASPDSNHAMVQNALNGETWVQTYNTPNGSSVFSVAAPVHSDAGDIIGVVGILSGEGEIDRLVSAEREQILQVFFIAIMVSVGLSLVLASTIANPLADLAEAAEVGRDSSSRAVAPGRVRIPDLSGRPDEIGRLSSALRGMISALYERIDQNEQFAADVAHEIKNPLASLRSAIGSLRVVKKQEQQEKLFDIIEHDVRRLDRLVSDISNASRLDSELVREEEEEFDLIKMLSNLTDYLSRDAQDRGIDFIADMPTNPIKVSGLEARLAQVFVNLITNAVSFCEEGDAIRVWVRRRDSRVLVVVEDTGPGIPEEALTKIFKRFYSERPAGQFGNNSGLGLAISKQIVEAHGGVIWAENIRASGADITSPPLGARFVVGLPL